MFKVEKYHGYPTTTHFQLHSSYVYTPFAHLKDKKTDAAKGHSRQVLPVDHKSVSFTLVLRTNNNHPYTIQLSDPVSLFHQPSLEEIKACWHQGDLRPMLIFKASIVIT